MIANKCHGKIYLQNLYENFIPENHPLVKQRKMSIEEVGMQFDEGMELLLKVLKDGKLELRNEIITFEEFEEFYKLASIAIVND